MLAPRPLVAFLLALLCVGCGGAPSQAAPHPLASLPAPAPTTVAEAATPVPAATAAPAAPTTAPTAQPVASPAPTVGGVPATPGLATLRVAYDALLDRYFRPLAPEGLAAAALSGLRSEAQRQRLDPAPAQGVDVGQDRQQAFGALAGAFTRLATAPSADPDGLALAAVRAMAYSLRESHTYVVPRRADGTTNALPRFDVVDRYSQGIYWLEGTNDAVVLEVAAGSPADQAGLRPGDQVVSVAGSRAVSGGSWGVRSQLASAEGLLRLGVRRPGVGLVQMDVRRSFSSGVPVLEARDLGHGVGALRLHAFPAPYRRLDDGHTVDEELTEDLEHFESRGVSAWVLDLRGNGGGPIDTLTSVLGRFVADGVVLARVNRAGQRGEVLVDGHPFHVQRPLAVLVDGGSASASELLAAAVQEQGRGLVVGQRTRGAVNVTSPTELPDGATLYITVAQALTGKDSHPLDGVGVHPDQPASVTPADLASGRDTALDQAAALVAQRAAREAPVTLPPPPVTLSPEALWAQLKGYLATMDDFAGQPGLQLYGWKMYNSLNRYASGAPDAAALRARAASRGWLGSVSQYFGLGGDTVRFYFSATLYRDAEAARQDLRRVDYPVELVERPSQATVGEEREARRGIGAAAGSTTVNWRRGRVTYLLAAYGPTSDDESRLVDDIATRLDSRLATLPAP